MNTKSDITEIIFTTRILITQEISDEILNLESVKSLVQQNRMLTSIILAQSKLDSEKRSNQYDNEKVSENVEKDKKLINIGQTISQENHATEKQSDSVFNGKKSNEIVMDMDYDEESNSDNNVRNTNKNELKQYNQNNKKIQKIPKAAFDCDGFNAHMVKNAHKKDEFPDDDSFFKHNLHGYRISIGMEAKKAQSTKLAAEKNSEEISGSINEANDSKISVSNDKQKLVTQGNELNEEEKNKKAQIEIRKSQILKKRDELEKELKNLYEY